MINLPNLYFDWYWIKDKQIILERIPYTDNYHLMITDGEDLFGLWLIEKV